MCSCEEGKKPFASIARKQFHVFVSVLEILRCKNFVVSLTKGKKQMSWGC